MSPETSVLTVILLMSLTCLVAAGLFTWLARRCVPGRPHLGAALVTGIVMGSGNIGVLIYLLEKGPTGVLGSGWPVIVTMTVGCVLLPLGAGAAAREDAPNVARIAALGWFTLTGLALAAAVAMGSLALLLRPHALPEWQELVARGRMFSQAMQPIAGALVLGLVLQGSLISESLRNKAVSMRGIAFAIFFVALCAGSTYVRGVLNREVLDARGPNVGEGKSAPRATDASPVR